MSKEIGAKVKHLRKSRKWTQEELAQRVGLQRSTLSNYEIGRRSPHLKDLQKLAKTFGVGIDYFGVTVTDVAFDVLARAKEVFESEEVEPETKEQLYREFMKLYLEMKGE